jgi:hypothetical protein
MLTSARTALGKRSSFVRHVRDAYWTPYEAVVPLLPFISGTFCEPCAGAGHLIRHLESHGMKCSAAYDREPQAPGIIRANALDLHSVALGNTIITNPPWSRDQLHPMIRHFSKIAPTWLLFDAPWAFTSQATPFLKRCAKIVAIGRVKWIDGSPSVGKDDSAWYQFLDREVETVFFGKAPKAKCDKTKDMFNA